MMALEKKLDCIDIKEAIVNVLNSIASGDYFFLNELCDEYTHELVRKNEYVGDFNGN